MANRKRREDGGRSTIRPTFNNPPDRPTGRQPDRSPAPPSDHPARPPCAAHVPLFCGQGSPEVGPCFAEMANVSRLGQLWAKMGPILTDSEQDWSASGQPWTKQAQLRPNSEEFDQPPANLPPNWLLFAASGRLRYSPSFHDIGLYRDRIGTRSAKLGRIRSTSGKHWPNSRSCPSTHCSAYLLRFGHAPGSF